jgi:predicted GTPase
MAFYKPDLTITVVDPHRPGHELTYYPGETNVRLADVIVVNKIDSASRENVERVVHNVRTINVHAEIVYAASPIVVTDPDVIRDKTVLAVEDGPTLTHGDMSFGAATLAARRYGAREIVDPRPFAVKSIADTFAKYPKTGAVLPAMGYGEKQKRDLEITINNVPCDSVLIGTPVDLRRIIKIQKPSVRVTYSLEEMSKPDLPDIIERLWKQKKKGRPARKK